MVRSPAPTVTSGSSSEPTEVLARVPAFATLEPADLRRIAEVALPRTFEPGEVVFRFGDPSDTCYVVCSGTARAVREHPDGRTITLATLGPGEIFGELAMFEDERRSATVEVLERMAVVAVLGKDMRELMARHPDISMRLVVALGRRLRVSNERLAQRSFQSVQSRVAAVLGELVEQELARAGRAGAVGPTMSAGGKGGREGADEAVLIRATQADLAKLAGSSRESASRFLAVLQRAGVISQGRGRLLVHDPKALASYVF
jgi:CRP/FNR family transcriptional regulator, cyclic AMP receptor protein